jgi:hypothetical protein
MIGAIMGAANLATGIAKGIVAKSAHNKYAKQLESMEMKMPDAVSQAEGVRTDLAYGDMPGFADMMAGVDSNTASTMTQAKQVATSPAALMDALVQSSTAGEQGKRELGVQNAQAQQTNQASLARFFESVKSPAEQRIIQFDIDKKIAYPNSWDIPIITKKLDICIDNLEINTNILKEMNCMYIFSSVEIKNYKDLDLTFLKSFTNEKSQYIIFLYKIY